MVQSGITKVKLSSASAVISSAGCRDDPGWSHSITLMMALAFFFFFLNLCKNWFPDIKSTCADSPVRPHKNTVSSLRVCIHRSHTQHIRYRCSSFQFSHWEMAVLLRSGVYSITNNFKTWKSFYIVHFCRFSEKIKSVQLRSASKHEWKL